MQYTKILISLFIANIILLTLLSTIFAIDLTTKQTLDINVSNYIYHTKKPIYDKDYEYASYSSNTKGSIVYLYKLYRAKGTLLVYINPSRDRIGTNIFEETKVSNISKINDKNEILTFSTAGSNKIFYISPSGKKYTQENPSYLLSNIKSTEDIFYWIGYNYVDRAKGEIDKLCLFTYHNYQTQKIDLEQIRNIQDLIDLEIIDKNTILIVKKDKSKQKLLKISNNKLEHLYTSELILLSKNKLHKNVYFFSRENNKNLIKFYDLQSGTIDNFYDLGSEYKGNSPLFFCIFKDRFNDFFNVSISISNNKHYLLRVEKLLFDQKEDKEDKKEYDRYRITS
ncbi:MAG: hypothetical protein ABDH21_00185 [bacterium]